MLDDAADVVQGEVGEARVAVAGEQVLAILPHGLVHVHAGAVVARIGLGHEGCRLAVGVGHVPDDVLLQLSPVGTLDQSREACTDFVLTGTGHFMVEHFDRNAHGLQQQRHFCTHVLGAVNGWHGEVAALVARTVTTVTGLELGASVPGSFVFFDFEEGVVRLGAPAHAVEDKEFGFGSEVSGIAQAGSLQVGFSALGNGAGIAVIGLAITGFDHIALQNQSGLFEEGIDIGSVGIGNQLHVRSFDTLPARHGRTVKSMARGELVFVEMRHGHGHVLLLAAGIGKAQVNELDLVVLHHLHHVCNGLRH